MKIPASMLGVMRCTKFCKQNFGASKTELFEINGRKYKFVMKDESDIANAYNISDAKVGAKYILKFNHPDFKDSRFLIDETSMVASLNGDFSVSLKEVQVPVFADKQSFTGKVWGSIRSDERGVDDNMKLAYKEFWTSGLKNYIERTSIDKKETPVLRDDYNFFIPSDGDGTRYRDMTLLQGDILIDDNNRVVRDEKGAAIPVHAITKPASELPANLPNEQSMKLVQGVLANFQRAGEVDELDFVEVKPAQGSAYALFEGLRTGQISTDKPLVFSWGDNFSDINIRKIMKAHEDANSDFTMLALAVSRDEIGSLGGVKVKSEDDMEALWFMEKPQTDEQKDMAKLPGKDEYLGTVGPFILSSKTLKWIKENYTKNPQNFKNAKGYDFSSVVIDTLVNHKDKLGDDFVVQVYRKPETETWSDLGALKDFKSQMYKLKNTSAYNGLVSSIRDSFKSHIDENQNISIGNGQSAINSISSFYGIDFRKVIAYK